MIGHLDKNQRKITFPPRWQAARQGYVGIQWLLQWPRLPGLAFAGIGVATAFAVSIAVPLSPLVVAMILGILMSSVVSIPSRFGPGLDLCARRLLRIGVVLLGLRLSMSELLGLGWPTLFLVLSAVCLTFVVTLWVGRVMGLSRGQTILTATGVSICGASAVVAINSVIDADEDEVASTVAVVSIYGTVMIFLLPLVAVPLGIRDELFGVWAGASVHEVAQVVATAGAVGSAALATAVVVKLTRVALLAPIVALVGLWSRRTSAPVGGRPPLVPLFLVGFLLAVTIRSTGILPSAILDVASVAEKLLFTAAMFALGCSVKLGRLARAAGARLLLGLASTLTICLVSFSGLLLVAA